MDVSGAKRALDIFGIVLWAGIGFLIGIVFGSLIAESQRDYMWVKHAEDKCYPLAVDHASPYLFDFRCAESENIRD